MIDTEQFQLISIITISYNSIKTIERTIKSVLAQKNVCLEYIIIDGLSIDGTVDIIRNYANKYKCIRWVSEKDQGIYDAMNKGIKMATSNIVGILNSDDFYASNQVLQRVIQVLSDINIDSCYGDLLYIKDEKPYRYWISGQPRSISFGWMPPHPALFIKKNIYDKYGLYRLDCGTSADYELIVRLFRIKKITTQWIHELFVVMTAGGASNQGFKSRMNANITDRKALLLNNLHSTNLTLFLKKICKIPQFVLARFFLFKFNLDVFE